MKESPEQQQAIKMMLTLAILAAIGLLLAACGSTGSGTTVLRSPVEFVNGIPISNSSRSGVDVQGFSSFLATNIGKIQSYGCQSPTENNPIILVDGIHTDRASVVGDSRVIHLPPGEVIDIEVLVHEFKHAFCSEPNLQFEPVTNDWSITEFVSGTGRNIKLTGQSGLYLQVEVDGEEDFLMGLEEMSASSFLRREIAQYKNEREGVQSGYGSQPRGYPDLYDRTHKVITEMTGYDYGIEMTYEILDNAFARSVGQNNGFKVVLNTIRESMELSGYAVPDNYEQRFIEEMVEWELSRSSSSIEPQYDIANSRINFSAKELALKTFLNDSVERDDKLEDLRERLDKAPNQRTRRKYYRKIITYLQKRSQNQEFENPPQNIWHVANV